MMAKSQENWQVGENCLKEGKFNAATSRLYYGLLQSIIAWARAKKGYNDIHGTHSAMYRYVSSEGRNKKVFGETLRAMLTLREFADYTPRPPDIEKLTKLIPTCKCMIAYYQKKATVEEANE